MNRRCPIHFFTCLLIIFWTTLQPALAEAVRIKDLANFDGVRGNQLIGYGLVVGLNGSGDKSGSEFTIHSISSMLEKFGVTVKPSDIKVKNVAAVMVTANLPPFSKIGSSIDVLVSSLGDAKSLQGGTLLLTPIRASNGEIHALAQGPISVGGFSVSGASGTTVQKNHPTVGRVVAGATIEKEIPYRFNERESLSITLHNPDFTTASRLVKTINKALGEGTAKARDSATVQLQVPSYYNSRLVELVASIESLDVDPDSIAKVIMDERTGTVVIGENVRISTVAVSSGALSIQIKESQEVSQPLPFSKGETTAVPKSDITVEENKSKLVVLSSGVSLSEVVRGLNAIGVSPRELIAIFQAIKAAGALQAELEIM